MTSAEEHPGRGASTASAVPARRILVAIWAASVIALGSLVAAARGLRTAGDDSDPGRQRPGILDLGELPQPAPDVDGITLPSGRRSVVFFASSRSVDDLCAALRADRSLTGESLVIVGPGASGCGGHEVVADVNAVRAARAYGLPAPRGDVAPTGYAVVDARGRIRYRTLDPVAPALLDEVATMLSGVR